MKTPTTYLEDPLIQMDLDELQTRIRAIDARATFEVTEGDDPEGVYLWATTYLEDPDEVLDAVIDQMIDLQVIEDKPIFVVPLPVSTAKPSRARGSVSSLLTLLSGRGAPNSASAARP